MYNICTMLKYMYIVYISCFDSQPTIRSCTALVMYINQIGVLSRPGRFGFGFSDQINSVIFKIT